MTNIRRTILRRPLGHKALARIAAAASAAAVIASLLPAAPAFSTESLNDGIRTMARLPDTPPAKLKATGIDFTQNFIHDQIVDVDAKQGRLLYVWRNLAENPNVYYLREYDIRPKIPKIVRESPIGEYSSSSSNSIQLDFLSPYTVVRDAKRERLLFLAQGPAGSRLLVVDLRRFVVAKTIDMSVMVPGYLAHGITYSPEDDRVYVVGEVASHYTLAFQDSQLAGAVRPAAVTALLAINAETDQRAWSRLVPQCQKPLNTASLGALIARAARPVLYFTCARTWSYPGESGLTRVFIDPKGTDASALSFRTEFFPVSGSYASFEGVKGASIFDRPSERVIIASQSPGTPGAWVFDGARSAWIGFIAAPDLRNWHLGLDPESGRLFMGGDPGRGTTGRYLIVTDGRATPIQQGTVMRSFDATRRMSGLNLAGHEIGVKKPIFADPKGSRLFMKLDLGLAGLGRQGEWGWMILNDGLPQSEPLEPPDYDELTSDVPEASDTVSTFSGGLDGFGARVLLVGGYAGATTIDTDTGFRPPTLVVSPGDRELIFARVGSLDLRDVGASASAQTVSPDTNTDEEWKTRQRDTGDRVEAQSDKESADEVRKLLAWPWPAASCLDGGGEGFKSERAGAYVSCDLAKGIAEAKATHTSLSVGGISIGSSSIMSRAWRDAVEGAVTETTAEATSVVLSVPSTGIVTINRIVQTARTVAHGRPGTAKVTWSRRLEGVAVRDASGNTREFVPECSGDECADVVALINDVLASRIRVDLPTPLITKTPRGAFAAIERSETDYLNGLTVQNDNSHAVPAFQVIAFNDGPEKSRLVVQLAAIRAGSIYTISKLDGPLPDEPFLPPTVQIPGPVLGGGTSTDSPQIQVVTRVIRPASDTGGRLSLLTRSPGESVLMALIVGLFASAVASIRRRRALLEFLDESGEVNG